MQDIKEKIQKCVKTFCYKNGYSPTYEEIRQAVGLKSVGAVKYHVTRLIESGKLAKRDGLYNRSLVPIVPPRGTG